MRSSNYNPAGERGLFRRDRRIWLQRGTHTYTIPDGVTKVWAFAIGAGSGGAICGASNTTFPNGGLLGGGEGGGYASGIISGLTPGGTLTLTVGAGGNGAFETTASQAGGNTTVVGGSTTYLQGNGGASASNTTITSDPGSKKGAGGGASTNSVTDAYTAAGGGQYNWPAGIGYGSLATNTMNLVMGGGASGTPWGTGMAGGKSIGNSGGATGGGGWCQIDYPRDQWLKGSSGSYGKTNNTSLGGYGSHRPPKYFKGRYQNHFRQGYDGGTGQYSRGGMGIYFNYFETEDDYIYDNKNLEVYDTPGMLPQKVADINRLLDGEEGNPDWWFPWEIDGGGGAGMITNNHAGMIWAGGDGGSGAGGGGAYGSTYNNDGNVAAGRGGFGGGGGGSYHSSNRDQDLAMSWGGDGGNGGGGGSAYGRIGSSKYQPIGGNGGDGVIGIYW